MAEIILEEIIEAACMAIRIRAAQALAEMPRVTRKDGSTWIVAQDVDDFAIRLRTHYSWP